jgi:hypothetical protein
MKQAEKQRLTALAREAVENLTCAEKLKQRVAKIAGRYSPTNAEQYRKLAEVVWWLIAVDCDEDALAVLDALCEVNDESFWMFHALASALATRSWIRAKRGEKAAARADAQAALGWIERDPNPKAITQSEVRGALERFDGWLERAAGERGTVTTLQVLSHALRVLVMYSQFAVAGDPASKAIPAREFATRMDAALLELRRRMDGW